MQSKGLARCGASLASLFWVASAFSAQEEGISNPPALTMGIDRAGAATANAMLEASGVTSRTVIRQKDPGAQLELRLKQAEIHDPKKGSNDKVWLRGYADLNATSADGLVAAPLIKAFPGQTVRFDIYNHLLPWDQLPAGLRQGYTQANLGKEVYEKLIPQQQCDPAAHDPATMNIPNSRPGCFNTTNNHFHGSWVNPAGNSDNVLRTLYPSAGVAHEYEYNIPADHPAGTFWYHPHVHGSTALQVASGVAGPLIVNGDRWPVPGVNGQGLRSGDIDVLLSRPDGKPIPDRVFMLQQIQYKCFAPDGTPKADKWNCAAGDIGAIVDYNDLGGPANWTASGRFTTVNGRVTDMLGIGSEPGQEKVIAGQPERWRLIHAGFNDSIKVQIFPAKPRPAQAETTLLKAVFSNTSAADNDRVIARECEVDGPPLKVFEIAADGLTRYQALEADSRVLQPGYRSDILVSFPQPAGDLRHQDYCVIDAPLSAQASVEGSVDSRRLLFTVRVERNDAQQQIADAKVVIHDTLVSAAKRLAADRQKQGLDTSKLPAILADLDAGLKLEHFSPHDRLTGQTLREQEDAWLRVDNVRLLRFNLKSVQKGVASAPSGAGLGHARLSRANFEAASDPAPQASWGKIEDVRFSERAEELIALQLGNTDEWRLRTADVAHPFHIHINPFQVVRVTRLADGVDMTGDATSQYFGMKDVYKDTIIVEPGVEVVVRSHYERYVGRFVLHCHILPHEDGGMMRLVEIFEAGIPGGLDFIEQHGKGAGGAANESASAAHAH